MSTPVLKGEVERISNLEVLYETLVARLERDLSAHIKSHDREHEVEQRSAELALQNLDRRLASMNEFRAQMADSETRYCLKTDLGDHAASNDKQLEGIGERLRNHEGTMATFFTKGEHEAYIKSVDSDIRILRESRAELQGKASQSQMNITFVTAIVGLLVACIGLLLKFFGK